MCHKSPPLPDLYLLLQPYLYHKPPTLGCHITNLLMVPGPASNILFPCFYAKKRQLYAVPLPYHCLLYFRCLTWLPSFNIRLRSYLHPQKYIWLLPALGHEKLTAKECKWFQMISSTFFSPEWANFLGSRRGLLSSVLTWPGICWDDQQPTVVPECHGRHSRSRGDVFDPPGLMMRTARATFYFRNSLL